MMWKKSVCTSEMQNELVECVTNNPGFELSFRVSIDNFRNSEENKKKKCNYEIQDVSKRGATDYIMNSNVSANDSNESCIEIDFSYYLEEADNLMNQCKNHELAVHNGKKNIRKMM
ncbi:hypothetical protein NPIL_533991 [Nephila pilipes]|uniref:Uncharacterized protein n=1 Tax=Nephila pilipes TaxID=299642 RepID=A0A8X6P6S7_NEPPI|nr:hypothetical protein NPIL_533991 [Nephila pilipes]